MRLFLLDVSPLEDEALFLKCYGECTESRRRKTDRLKNQADRRLCVGCGVLLSEIFREYGIKKPKLKISEYGKPYLDGERLFFNLSHSGKYAAAAVSDAEVGIDIEKCRRVNLKVADRYFTAAEREYIYSKAEEKERQDAFLSLWTKKESFLKAVGKGLNIPLDSFDVLCDGDGMRELFFDNIKYYIYEYKMDGYIASLCGQKPQKEALHAESVLIK